MVVASGSNDKDNVRA